MPRLAIVSSHPIQYYAPLFRSLAQSGRVQPRVFYTWSQTAQAPVADTQFGRNIAWDIPLLDGYEYEFVPNVARRPGTHHFWGLRNPGLVHAISAWRPEALLVFGWNSHSHLGVMRHFSGRIPVLFRGDSTLLDPRSPWRSALRRIALRQVYRHVDIALAVGANNRDYFRWCGLREDQIVLAPHAVDTERFGADEARHRDQALQWRRQLGIPAEARVLVFAAKLIAKKAPMQLLEAFLQTGAGAHLVFVGDGELGPALRARAAGHPGVHFVSFQNQQAMPTVYRLGEIYVLPSCGPGETWGLAMNEALACSSLLIASDRVGGARDVVQEGATGWTFRSGDGAELAGLIRRVLDCSGPQLATMRVRARQESSRWSIASASAAIERAVLDCVA